MKSRKLLLINPPSDCVENDRVEPPLGLLYLASAVRETGLNDITLNDMTGCSDTNEIDQRIDQIEHADVYGISCLSTNYPFVKSIVNSIKEKYPLSLIILGGAQPSAMPEFTQKDTGTDVIIIGEGEDAFTSCVNAKDFASIRNSIIRGSGRDDIDSYAFPDRTIVDMRSYSRKLMDQPVISLLSSRGCDQHCIHCNSTIMGGGSHNVRYRSTKNIIDEIEQLRADFAFFRFNDDNFAGNPNLNQLLTELKDLDIKFRIFSRIGDLSESVCHLLRQAGCVHVTIGIESLNDDNLRFIGKKDQIGHEENIHYAKDNGLTIRASFMVGLPYDTDVSIFQDFSKAAQLGIDEYAIYPLIPYPGTMVWKHPEKYGYKIINEDFTEYVQMGKEKNTCFALDHENFSHEDVIRWLKTSSEILKQSGIKHMRESSIAS